MLHYCRRIVTLQIYQCSVHHPLPQEALQMVDRTLINLQRNYSAAVMQHLLKSATVARKMLTGQVLSMAEEEFLLKKLDV